MEKRDLRRIRARLGGTSMIRIVLMIAMWLVGSSAPVAAQSANSCGKASCYLFLRQLGAPVTYETLDAQFAGLGPETSFADLAKVLGNLGVPVTGMKMEWDDFRRLDSPSIVKVVLPRIDTPHFHVVTRVGGELVVLDPLRDRPLVLAEAGESGYRQAFSGYVLVPSASVPWQFSFGGSRLTVVTIGAALAAMVFYLGRRSRLARLRDSVLPE